MATVSTTYLGELRTEAIHLQSQNELITDAPTDNQGRGEAFSPTDLLATSLGTCMLTTMAIRTRDKGVDLDGTKCDVTKIMAQNPRRVGEIRIEFKFPKAYSEEERRLLENAAMTCPVMESLHPDLRKSVDFGW